MGSSTLTVEGQPVGNHQHDMMGVYEQLEGKKVNRRGVWQMVGGGKDIFMYYASNNKWFVGKGMAAMEAGKAAGAMGVASSALTPEKITETWRVSSNDGKWPNAPLVRVWACGAVGR
jgi:hypothetical protein